MGRGAKENGFLSHGFFKRKSPPQARAASPGAAPGDGHEARTPPSRLPSAPAAVAGGHRPGAAAGASSRSGGPSGPQLRLLPPSSGASTPRSFVGRAPQSARGPAPLPAAAAARLAADGSQTARRVPKLAPALHPGVSSSCTYKQALTTPRLASASKLPGPPPPAGQAPSPLAGRAVPPPLQPLPAAPPMAQQQQQQLDEVEQQHRQLAQQQARAEHEQEHMQQQIRWVLGAARTQGGRPLALGCSHAFRVASSSSHRSACPPRPPLILQPAGGQRGGAAGRAAGPPAGAGGAGRAARGPG